MSNTSQRRSSSFSSLIFLIIAIAIASLAYLHRQAIIDAVRGFQYHPSAAVSSLRNKLQLTSSGAAIFNASVPEIESASTFNSNCQQNAETNNPILGCYVRQQIFIFDVQNKKLDGIEETTAAHELLHAVYDRMSASDKAVIDQEVQAAYERVKTPELEKRMEYYKNSELGQELNELHSILGTEFTGLGVKLEEHYANYFKNRSQITAYYSDYNSVFTSATQRLKTLESEINQKIALINQQIKQYNQDAQSLSSDVEEFNRQNQNGDFSSQRAFDSEKQTLVARQDNLNNQKNLIQSNIAAVDELKSEYNQLAKEYNQLSESINSSIKTTPLLK